MAKNVYRNTKMKILFNMEFNFTRNSRQFDVNVLEKHIAYSKKIIMEICVCLAFEIRSKHICMFFAQLFETS